MNKEILDTLDDLSKRPTTELAMRLMETTVDNMAKDKELDKYKNIVDELERYIKDELILDFYNDDMPCELIVNKMLKQIKELKGE